MRREESLIFQWKDKEPLAERTLNRGAKTMLRKDFREEEEIYCIEEQRVNHVIKGPPPKTPGRVDGNRRPLRHL